VYYKEKKKYKRNEKKYPIHRQHKTILKIKREVYESNQFGFYLLCFLASASNFAN